MAMTVDAAQQPRELVQIGLEHTRHIVVELQVERWYVHGHHSMHDTVRHTGNHVFQETKVRYGLGIVVFHAVGIETDKKHTASNKIGVGRTEDTLMHTFARAQTIMVPEQGHPGLAQAKQNVALHLQFMRSAKVGQVTAMNHKVDILAAVDVAHRLLRLVIPALCVTDKSEADSVLALGLLRDARSRPGIDASFTAHLGIIGMCLEHVASL